MDMSRMGSKSAGGRGGEEVMGGGGGDGVKVKGARGDPESDLSLSGMSSAGIRAAGEVEVSC